MTAAPRDLARNAEASRARLDLAIDRLERRLSPAGLLDEAVGMAQRSASLPAVDRALATAKENPLPVLLIAAGAGLFAWRLWNGRNGCERPGPDVPRNGATSCASRTHVAPVERTAAAQNGSSPHTLSEGEPK